MRFFRAWIGCITRYRTASALAWLLSCGTATAGVPLDGVDWAYGVPAGAAAGAGGAPATTAAGTTARPAKPPAEARPAATPGAAPEAEPEQRYSLPGAAGSFTRRQIANPYGPADWYPEDHPKMPEIVAVGRRQAGIMACSLCHYPNGKGRPENAGLAGLPKGYIVEQLHDFAAGVRSSAEPRKTNTNLMIAFARAMTESEIQQAAEYFSSMRWTPWIDVAETETVPKTRIAGGMYLRLEGADAGSEPIRQRIVEAPRSTERTERLRDPRSGFIAYVPPGSLERGKALVTTGGARSIACVICHGPSLEGLALVPPLAGRSPSYIARQLYDFQRKTRRGTWAPLMSQVVANLTAEDIVDVSAYVASQMP